MKILFEMLTKLWYLWIMVIVAGILEIYMPKIKGYFGEKSVAFFLSKLDRTKYKVINNRMLQVENRTTQIDHVVVSNFGIFVIETKNYKGWIIGNEFDDDWKQVIYKRNEKLHNPINQNYGHIKVFKEALGDYTDINYISIVAFTTKVELKVTSKTDVVYTINLLKTIKKYITKTISESVKGQIYDRLISINIDSKDNRKSHVEAIHDNLIKKCNQVNNDICPKCGDKLILRNGKYGKFKGCSSYPKCRFIIK